MLDVTPDFLQFLVTKPRDPLETGGVGLPGISRAKVTRRVVLHRAFHVQQLERLLDDAPATV